jgi:hypothetical protein
VTQVGDGLALTSETLGVGEAGAEVVAGAAVLELGDVVAVAVLLVGAAVVGVVVLGGAELVVAAAELVAGAVVPVAESPACWLLDEVVVSGDVVPGAVLPAAVLPADVLPADVLPAGVVPGDVVPGEVDPGEVVPGDVVPDEVRTALVAVCELRGGVSAVGGTDGGGDPSGIASPTGVTPVPGTPAGTGGSGTSAGPVATRTAPAYPLSHIVVTSTNSPGCGACTILPPPRYIATWCTVDRLLGSYAQNSRSPGNRLGRSTAVPTLACSRDVRGSATPAVR